MSSEPQAVNREFSQVEEHQEALQAQIGAYEEKLSQLEERLERVLQPVENSGAENSAKQDEALCPLAEWLRDKHRIIGLINGRLDHLLEHLML